MLGTAGSLWAPDWDGPCISCIHALEARWGLEEVWGVGQCMCGFFLNGSDFLWGQGCKGMLGPA